jgi:hypothetical protein
MEQTLRIFRSITIMIACGVVFIVGMSMDLSLKHVRDELQSATAGLTFAHSWQSPLRR